ncbi:hypothetical protein X777_12374 [Ooceraea biroi]|uniref:Uncharacterized protein n=1 Tax=Ooceraea biroi TaxID=2015173 RepID=A0A026W2T6_OOCBI|nr:hypothetical protein X777_12374 [Ooceraea biroi]
MHSGAIIVEIAAYIAACIFNNGMTSILQIMSIIGISDRTHTNMLRAKMIAA